MIITEQHYIDNQEFIRTYSNSGRYVVRDGVSYEEAYDPAKFNRTYTEGELIPIEDLSSDDYAQIGRIMMGVEP